ncbi:MAG: recombinase family protein [Candidatus Methylomirabilales bacterium]
MTETRPPQIKAHHLQRLALVYLRQSSAKQVELHTGSTAHQRHQKTYALQWGWPDSAIEVVDADLGLSGTSGDHRKGWQRMLKLVSEDAVGIIFVSDISRLSRLRRDFATLVDLCREFDVLLAVDGAIVNFDDPTDRFMANIRADVAEYDNEVRKNTFMKAKLAKAQQGHAVTPCPTGYVESKKGKWVKDPDLSVRRAIEEVFRQYQVLGTVGRVLQFFADHQFKLPTRRGAGAAHWGPTNRARIHDILTNPAFAGYYVLGRHSSGKGARMGGGRRADWRGCITFPDHHEPYLPPAEWHQLYERLRSNAFPVRQPAGSGPALCQGLIRCGRCGRKLSTHYCKRSHSVGIGYRCMRARQQYGDPLCWSVNGNRLDEVVAAEVLKALASPEVEAVIAAADEANAGYEATRQQRQDELDDVQQEADLAERRFKKVHPDNRRVAAGLEQDLERALERVHEVERKHAETSLAPPLEVTPESLEAIRRAAADLPGLWADPSTTDYDRKLVVRFLVREIRVVATSESDFDVDIAWVAGATTRHHIAGPLAGRTLARQLAARGLTEREIAAELNRLGVTTVYRRGLYTPEAVRSILWGAAHKAGTAPPPWRIYREELRAPLTELAQAGWSHGVIADEFNRRGLRSYHHRTPWNSNKVRWLQRALGIQRAPRVRVRKNSRAAVEPLHGPLTELAQAGWTNAAIAAEFSRRGLRGFAARTHWNRDSVRYLRRLFGIPSSRDPGMRLRKVYGDDVEPLRGLLTELAQAGWTNAAIAAECTRRGLRGFAARTRWNENKVRRLRRLFGIPSVGFARVRSRKAHVHDPEQLRVPLTELVQAGWIDRVIAADFNRRRDLPKWGYRDSWSKAKIYELRRALGIQAVPRPRVQLRKIPPASKAEG